MDTRLRLDATRHPRSEALRPWFTPAEVDAFVDRLEAPSALRDPISRQMMRRPVTVRQRDGAVPAWCVDEAQLRRLLDRAGRYHEAGDQSDPLYGARLSVHLPMSWQLHRFYADALERASARFGAQSERSRAITEYVDAALYEVRQPLMPILARSEQATWATEALQPLERADEAALQLQREVEQYTPRLTQSLFTLTDLEEQRQALLLDLRALRVHLRDAHRGLWRVRVPQSPLTQDFLNEWQAHFQALGDAASSFEETLRIDAPLSLAERARTQRSAVEAAWRRRRAPDEP